MAGRLVHTNANGRELPHAKLDRAEARCEVESRLVTATVDQVEDNSERLGREAMRRLRLRSVCAIDSWHDTRLDPTAVSERHSHSEQL